MTERVVAAPPLGDDSRAERRVTPETQAPPECAVVLVAHDETDPQPRRAARRVVDAFVRARSRRRVVDERRLRRHPLRRVPELPAPVELQDLVRGVAPIGERRVEHRLRTEQLIPDVERLRVGRGVGERRARGYRRQRAVEPELAAFHDHREVLTEVGATVIDVEAHARRAPARRGRTPPTRSRACSAPADRCAHGAHPACARRTGTASPG